MLVFTPWVSMSPAQGLCLSLEYFTVIKLFSKPFLSFFLFVSFISDITLIFPSLYLSELIAIFRLTTLWNPVQVFYFPGGFGFWTKLKKTLWSKVEKCSLPRCVFLSDE